MSFYRLAFRLSSPCGLLLSCLLGGLLTASAQAQEARPRSERAPVQAIGAVATHALSALDNAALQARYPATPGPLRFAEPRATALQAHDTGTWETLDDGTMLWRLRVRSENARSINLGFTAYHMPPGGELFLYAPAYESVVGPFTDADNAAHGELWTPVIPGDEVIIEVTVPADRRSALRLELGQVSHGFRAVRPSARKSSGACNVDIACEDDDLWRDQARAVGTYSLGGSTICTGVLVNNTAGDQTPYFLTANHCSVTEFNAPSMVVYWNYEHSTCRSGNAGGEGDGSLDMFTSGAIHHASYSGPSPDIPGGPDVTLVELDEPIDPEYDVRFAGWDRTGDPPPESVTIHHPQGQEKRISFDFDPATVTSYLEPTVTDEPSHLRVGSWDVGTTEPGSSGSPLFDPDGRVVGVLSGGYAACGNNAPDWYGRFSRAWTGGGAPDTRLRDWLDPLGIGAVATLGRDANEHDDDSPGTVHDLEVANVDNNRVTLSWTSPGDNGFQGTVSFYDLRYSTAPIRSADDFDAAMPISEIPIPAPAGTEQTAVVDSLAPDASYHFGIVAYDNAGNRSPVGTTPTETVLLRDDYLLEIYPNPFQDQTTVRFATRERQRLEIELFDTLGRRVQTLYREVTAPSRINYIPLHAQSLSSGRYFMRLTGESFTTTKPITLVR